MSLDLISAAAAARNARRLTSKKQSDDESDSQESKLGILPAATFSQPPTPEPGILGKAADYGLSALGALGNFLDVPGSMVRDVTTWVPGGIEAQNPFDQLLTPFSGDNRVTGEEMLQSAGIVDKDSWPGFLGGLAVEIGLDPLTYLSGGSLAVGKGGLAAAKAGFGKAAVKRVAQKKADDLAQKAMAKPTKIGSRTARMTTTVREVLDDYIDTEVLQKLRNDATQSISQKYKAIEEAARANAETSVIARERAARAQALGVAEDTLESKTLDNLFEEKFVSQRNIDDAVSEATAGRDEELAAAMQKAFMAAKEQSQGKAYKRYYDAGGKDEWLDDRVGGIAKFSIPFVSKKLGEKFPILSERLIGTTDKSLEQLMQSKWFKAGRFADQADDAATAAARGGDDTPPGGGAAGGPDPTPSGGSPGGGPSTSPAGGSPRDAGGPSPGPQGGVDPLGPAGAGGGKQGGAPSAQAGTPTSSTITSDGIRQGFASRSRSHQLLDSQIQKLGDEGILDQAQLDLVRTGLMDSSGIPFRRVRVRSVDEIVDDAVGDVGAKNVYAGRNFEQGGKQFVELSRKAFENPEKRASLAAQTLLHEFGHAFITTSAKLQDAAGASAREVFQRFLDDGKLVDYFTKNYSQARAAHYLQNPDEAFAQVFADHVLKNKIPDKQYGGILASAKKWLTNKLDKIRSYTDVEQTIKDEAEAMADLVGGYITPDEYAKRVTQIKQVDRVRKAADAGSAVAGKAAASSPVVRAADDAAEQTPVAAVDDVVEQMPTTAVDDVAQEAPPSGQLADEAQVTETSVPPASSAPEIPELRRIRELNEELDRLDIDSRGIRAGIDAGETGYDVQLDELNKARAEIIDELEQLSRDGAINAAKQSIPPGVGVQEVRDQAAALFKTLPQELRVEFRNAGTYANAVVDAITGIKKPVTAPAAYAKVINKGAPDTDKIAFITGKHNDEIAAFAKGRDDMGVLVTPDNISLLKHANKYSFFAIDNGAFGKYGFRPEYFAKLIDKVAADPDLRKNLLFVVAPDVVGDAEKTLEMFEQYAPMLRERELPVAFVAQDGLENMLDRVPWDDFDVLFVGGSDQFKLGEVVNKKGYAELFGKAQELGKPIHLGRANSNERIFGYGPHIGAATADGTMLAIAPRQNLQKLKQWLKATNEDGIRYEEQLYPELGRLPSDRELHELASDVASGEAIPGSFVRHQGANTPQSNVDKKRIRSSAADMVRPAELLEDMVSPKPAKKTIELNPFQMTKEEYVAAKEQRLVRNRKGDALTEKALRSQRESWEQDYEIAIQNAPRDADISPRVLESLPDRLRASLLRLSEARSKMWTEYLLKDSSEATRLVSQIAKVVVDDYARKGYADRPRKLLAKYSYLSDADKVAAVRALAKAGVVPEFIGRKRKPISSDDLYKEIEMRMDRAYEDHTITNPRVPFAESEFYKKASLVRDVPAKGKGGKKNYDIAEDAASSSRKATEEEIREYREAKKKGYKRRKDRETTALAKSLRETGEFTLEGTTYRGEAAAEKFWEFSQKKIPPTVFKEFPHVPTKFEMQASLKSDQRGRVVGVDGSDFSPQKGEFYKSRLDIPAYNATGNYIVTLHDKDNVALGYTSAVRLLPDASGKVVFETSPRAALNIAADKVPKTSIAKVNGVFDGSEPEEVVRLAREAFENKDEWVQLSMNPDRGSGFFNKETGRPVKAADEVIQVGALVLAKKEGLVEATARDFQVGKDGNVFFDIADDVATAGARSADEVEDAARAWAEQGTESPYFKRWFGRSRIVDEGGRPLVVYHGTRRDFDQFKVPSDGLINHKLGVHLAKDVSVTDAFTTGAYARNTRAWSATPENNLVDTGSYLIEPGGNVKPLYLRMENPYVIPDRGKMDQTEIATEAFALVMPENPEALAQFLQYMRGLTKEESLQAIESLNSNTPFSIRSLVKIPEELISRFGDAYRAFAYNYGSEFGPKINGKDWSDFLADSMVRKLKKEGYDGIQYKNTSSNEVVDGADPTAYIAFDPEQIKSATGNRGTFSPTDPRINYDLSDGVDAAKDLAGNAASKVAGTAAKTRDYLLDPSLRDDFSARLAYGMDAASDMLFDNRLSASVSGLFSPEMMGAVNPEAQMLAPERYRQIDADKAAMRDRMYPVIRSVLRSPAFDERAMLNSGLSSKEVNGILIKNYNAITEYIEGAKVLLKDAPRGEGAGAAAQAIELPAELESLRPALNQIKGELQGIRNRELGSGLKSVRLDDLFIDYLPRQRFKFAGDKTLTGKLGKFLEPQTVNQIPREDFLKDIPGGTALINEITIDPKISGWKHLQPDKAIPPDVMSEMREYLVKTYGGNREAGDRLFMLDDDNMQLDQFIQWVTGLDPRHAELKIPAFKVDPFSSVLARLEAGAVAAGGAELTTDWLARSARTTRQVAEGTGKEIDGVNLTELISRFSSDGFDRDRLLDIVVTKMGEPYMKERGRLQEIADERLRTKLENALSDGAKAGEVAREGQTVIFQGKEYKYKGMTEDMDKIVLTRTLYDDVESVNVLPREVSAPTVGRNTVLRNFKIDKGQADAMVRYMNGFTEPDAATAIREGLTSITNLYRSGLTVVWPAFHVRNVISGMYQNFLGGAFSARSMKEADAIFRGQDIDDAINFPAVRRAIQDRADKDLQDSVWDFAVMPPEDKSKSAIDAYIGNKKVKVVDAERTFGGGANVTYVDDAGKEGTTTLSKLEAAKVTPTKEMANEELRRMFFVNRLFDVNQGMTGEFLAGDMENLRGQLIGDTKKRLRDILKPPKAPPGTSKLQQANPLAAAGVFGNQQDAFLPYRWGRQAGQYAEGLVRGAPFIELLRKGYVPEEAARKVRELQFDYSRTTPADRYARIAFPFWSYTKNIVPLTVRQLMERPGGALAQTIRASSNAKTDEPLPGYLTSTAAIPFGRRGGASEGQSSFITGLGLGFEDPLQLSGALSGNFADTGRNIVSRMNPLFKAPLEAAFGESSYYDGPGGGRALTDLDPTYGRIVSNITDMVTGENTIRPKPIFNSPMAEQVLSNLPTSRIGTTLRTVTDKRKWENPAKLLLNLGTGVRVTDLSEAAWDADVQNTVMNMMKDMGARDFTRTYFPQYVKDQMTEEEKQTSQEIQGLLDWLATRAKNRSEQRKLENAAEEEQVDKAPMNRRTWPFGVAQ